MKAIRLPGSAPPKVPRRNWTGANARPFFLQLAIDIGAIVFGALFIVATALSVPLAVFMLLFCNY